MRYLWQSLERQIPVARQVVRSTVGHGNNRHQTTAVPLEMKKPNQPLNRRHPFRRLTAWLGAASAVLLASSATSALAQARTPGEIKNIDVRYPCFLDSGGGGTFYPDDVEIVCYGPELQLSDVIWTYDTGEPFSPGRLGWGQPTLELVENFVDPNDPAFPGNGLNCLTVRWAGDPRPDLGPFTGAGLGQLVHIGVQFRPSAGVLHCEIWWTVDGVRVANACDPKLTFICATRTTIVCIENPYPVPLYVYGCRFFQPLPSLLPRLDDLQTDIRPSAFGANDWIALPPPAPVICLQPWCRIYLPITTTTWTPIVVQVATSFTVEVTPGPDGGPNPDDPNTVAILTSRPALTRAADANGDGVVGIPDIGAFQQEFGLPNPDLAP